MLNETEYRKQFHRVASKRIREVRESCPLLRGKSKRVVLALASTAVRMPLPMSFARSAVNHKWN